MRIIAKDGVDGFKTVDECLEYEDALDAAEKERKTREEELRKTEKERAEEIKRLYAEFMAKVTSFEKDYRNPVQFPSHGYSKFFL